MNLNWINKIVANIDKILLIIISIIISLYLVETYLFFLQKKIYTNNRIQIVEKINFYEQGKILAVNPSNHLINQKQDFLPLSGISHENTIYCNEEGYYEKYNSDRYGFNNPDDIWGNSIIDYLLIGDSFVQGACVHQKYNISFNLKKISNKKVLNLGMDSNGPLLNLATIREYLFKDKVKNVLWFYYEGNDLHDLQNEIQFDILKKYISDESFSQNLLNQQSKINKFNSEILHSKFKELKKKSKNIKKDQTKFSFKFYYLRNLLFYKDNQKLSSEFEIIIKSLKNFTIKKNLKLYFIYLPEFKRYSRPVYINDNYKKIIEIIENSNIELIDLHKELFKNEYSVELFSKEKTHYSKKGYKLVASKIYEIIK
jgi:hypothetical protein